MMNEKLWDRIKANLAAKSPIGYTDLARAILDLRAEVDRMNANSSGAMDAVNIIDTQLAEAAKKKQLSYERVNRFRAKRGGKRA